MMIMGEDEKEKSQLVKEICELLSNANSCANLHHSHRKNKSPFINWYLVLRVDESADVCGIRKQYHKLALKLHPDKNKHSKAETAFKLVSEAYFCLSDGTRRAAFDSEKKIISCIKCNTIPYKNSDLSPNHTNPHQETFSRSNRFQRRPSRDIFKEIRRKLKEEATIIEKCLIANAAASRQELVNSNGTRSESPVFNPADYRHKGYGCLNQRTFDHTKLEELRAGFKIGNMCMQNRGTNSYPVFQHRSKITSFMS